ncbi:MAG: N-acetylmuramoyl-L-alanine amidase [Firmicutes bacterium]|nr:N-acetylmuramoyl-L-alanine amidase [Bacillota bacterium]
MPEFEIEFVGTPNHTKGRRGSVPIAIVNHITGGNYPGCLSWMQNPAAQASAHYLVTRSGKILQLVKDEDAAWHAGRVNKANWPLYKGSNPNRYTLGIEHEGFNGDLTEVQYRATVWLQKKLIQKWDIPVGEDYIIGHYRIDSVDRPYCPGPKFPWDELFKDLKEGLILDKLAEWERKMGEDAVNALSQKGLLSNPQKWLQELGGVPQNWLFFVMMDRLASYMGGKEVK